MGQTRDHQIANRASASSVNMAGVVRLYLLFIAFGLIFLQRLLPSITIYDYFDISFLYNHTLLVSAAVLLISSSMAGFVHSVKLSYTTGEILFLAAMLITGLLMASYGNSRLHAEADKYILQWVAMCACFALTTIVTLVLPNRAEKRTAI